METRMTEGGFGSDEIFPDNEEILFCRWLFVKMSVKQVKRVKRAKRGNL